MDNLKNIKELSNTHPIKEGLRKVFPTAMSLTLTQKVIVNGKETAFFQPSELLKNLLEKEVSQYEKAKNALAIIDPFGNLLALGSDRFDLSPIHTAMHKVLGDLTEFRFSTIDEELKRRP